MQLRTHGHQFELPAVKYEFNKRNFIVWSLFNYVWFVCFHLCCANVICIKLLLTYLFTYCMTLFYLCTCIVWFYLCTCMALFYLCTSVWHCSTCVYLCVSGGSNQVRGVGRSSCWAEVEASVVGFSESVGHGRCWVDGGQQCLFSVESDCTCCTFTSASLMKGSSEYGWWEMLFDVPVTSNFNPIIPSFAK